MRVDGKFVDAAGEVPPEGQFVRLSPQSLTRSSERVADFNGFLPGSSLSPEKMSRSHLQVDQLVRADLGGAHADRESASPDYPTCVDPLTPFPVLSTLLLSLAGQQALDDQEVP